MSDVVIQANASGSASVTLAAQAINSAATLTLPNQTGPIGYANIPAVGTKTSSYTLLAADVGKYVEISTGGSIVIPASTFSAGDVVMLFNNTSGSITITCSAVTSYLAGDNTVKTSLSLLTRGVATIFFNSASLAIISGNAL